MKQKYAIEKNGLDLLQDAYDRLSHLKKEQSSNPEIEKLSTQMKNKLNNMTVNVVKHEFNEVCVSFPTRHYRNRACNPILFV